MPANLASLRATGTRHLGGKLDGCELCKQGVPIDKGGQHIVPVDSSWNIRAAEILPCAISADDLIADLVGIVERQQADTERLRFMFGDPEHGASHEDLAKVWENAATLDEARDLIDECRASVRSEVQG